MRSLLGSKNHAIPIKLWFTAIPSCGMMRKSIDSKEYFSFFICGHSSLVEHQLPKLRRRVRFPLAAFSCTGICLQRIPVSFHFTAFASPLCLHAPGRADGSSPARAFNSAFSSACTFNLIPAFSFLPSQLRGSGGPVLCTPPVPCLPASAPPCKDPSRSRKP